MSQKTKVPPNSKSVYNFEQLDQVTTRYGRIANKYGTIQSNTASSLKRCQSNINNNLKKAKLSKESEKVLTTTKYPIYDGTPKGGLVQARIASEMSESESLNEIAMNGTKIDDYLVNFAASTIAIDDKVLSQVNFPNPELKIAKEVPKSNHIKKTAHSDASKSQTDLVLNCTQSSDNVIVNTSKNLPKSTEVNVKTTKKKVIKKKPKIARKKHVEHSNKNELAGDRNSETNSNLLSSDSNLQNALEECTFKQKSNLEEGTDQAKLYHEPIVENSPNKTEESGFKAFSADGNEKQDNLDHNQFKHSRDVQDLSVVTSAELDNSMEKIYFYLPDCRENAENLLQLIYRSSIYLRMKEGLNWKDFLDTEFGLIEKITELRSESWTYLYSKDWSAECVLTRILRKIRKYEKLDSSILSENVQKQRSLVKLNEDSYFQRLYHLKNSKIKKVQSSDSLAHVLQGISSSISNPEKDAQLLNSLANSSSGPHDGNIEMNQDKVSEIIDQLTINTDGPHQDRPRPVWLDYANKPARKDELYPRQTITLHLYPLEQASCDMFIKENQTVRYVQFSDWVENLKPNDLNFTDLKEANKRLVNRLVCHLIGPNFRRQPYFDPENLKSFSVMVATKYWPLTRCFGALYTEFKELAAQLGKNVKLTHGVVFGKTFKGDVQHFGGFIYKSLKRRLETKKKEMLKYGIENVWKNDEITNKSENSKRRGRGRPRKHELNEASRQDDIKKKRLSKIPSVINKRKKVPLIGQDEGEYDSTEDEDEDDLPGYFIDPADAAYANDIITIDT